MKDLGESLEDRLRKNLARIEAAIDTARKKRCEARNKAGSTERGEETPVKLIAVSKYQPLESICALYRAGQCSFGENRVQELRQKVGDLPRDMQAGGFLEAKERGEAGIRKIGEGERGTTARKQSKAEQEDRQGQENLGSKRLAIEWHFLGSLQRNKINALLTLNPALIHSVDSTKLALSLNEACKARERIQPVLLQVNAANEPSKHGFSLQEAPEAFCYLRQQASHLRLQGLMSIGAHSDDRGLIRESFLQTQALYESLRKQYEDLDVLSMGMSYDFLEAIACGSTMVRIGSALFR